MKYSKVFSISFVTLFASLLLNTEAIAEWYLIEKGNSVDFYVDFESVTTPQNDGYTLQILVLGNLKKKSKDGYISVMAKWEYDCKNIRKRALTLTGFSAPMGKGKVLTTEPVNDSSWQKISSDTTDEAILNISCLETYRIKPSK
jgi:hypothetical protein